METHKAIIKGQVLRLRYYPYENYSYDDSLRRTGSEWVKHCAHRFVKWEEIWRGEINSPLLEAGESFYIEDLDVKTKITERIRTTSGSYFYETEHIVEILKDDKTRESEEATDKEILDKNGLSEEAKYENNLAYIREDREQIREKSLFEKWFGAN